MATNVCLTTTLELKGKTDLQHVFGVVLETTLQINIHVVSDNGPGRPALMQRLSLHSHSQTN